MSINVVTEDNSVITIIQNEYTLISLEQPSYIVQIIQAPTEVVEVLVPGIQGPRSDFESISQAVIDYLDENPIAVSWEDVEDKPEFKNGSITEFVFGPDPPSNPNPNTIWIKTAS